MKLLQKYLLISLLIVAACQGDETIKKAGEAARSVIHPITDMRGTEEFRLHVTGVLTERVLKKAVERARG